MIYIFVLILIFIGIYKYDLSRQHVLLRRNSLFVLIGFILFFIAAFRYYNGGDTANYVNDFLNMPSFSSLKDFHFDCFRYQKGYIYYVSILKEIWNNFLIQQIVTALFVNVVIFRFIKKYSPVVFLTTLIYFILNYFEFNMEIMRESISVALGLLAYEVMRSKRYILMAVLIYIAYQFHVSALVLILMPLFGLVKYSRKSHVVFLFFAVLLPTLYLAIPNLEYYASLLFADQEEWAINAYVNQDYNKKLSMIYYITHFLRFLIIPFAAVWYINKYTKFKFTGLVYAYALLQLLGMFSYAFYRFANYFAPFYWIAIAYAIYLLASKFREIRTLVVALTLLVFLYLNQSVQLGWDAKHNRYMYNRYIPYELVFFNHGYQSSNHN